MITEIQTEIETINAWEDAVNIGVQITESASDSHWLIGDLANKIMVLKLSDPNLPKRAATLRSFSVAIGQPYDILKDAARVCRAVPKDLRAQYASLTYGHFREIVRCGFTGEELIKWANIAADDSLSIGKLRMEIRKLRKDREVNPVKDLRVIIGRAKVLTLPKLKHAAEDSPDDMISAKMACQELIKRIESLVNRDSGLN